ncbi:hypothetical protein KJ885_04115 [Patescibacteria group bacterium]|nr:hypothetical protein [Patescibacteria group bacterium]
MSFRQYIILMTTSSLLAWVTWGFVLFGISPNEAGLGVFFLFYISLLLAIACSLSILGLVVRVWLLKQKNRISFQAGKSFRQAMLLGTLVVGLLYFQSKGILSWWTIALLVAILTMVEFFLISYKKKVAE